MEDDDNVAKLPVKFKSPEPGEKVLFQPYEVGRRECYHERFVVDKTHAQVTCKDCKEKLDPIWVLHHLTNREGTFARHHEQYADEMKRLHERSRTKCMHCGQLTLISRR